MLATERAARAADEAPDRWNEGSAFRAGSEALMADRGEEHGKLKETLASCESRLKKLTGEAKSNTLASELAEIEKQLKACRLEINELEGKSDDEWLDAKFSVVRMLDDLERSLQLSQDRLEDFLR
jgi:hypothetical protein